MGWMGNFSLLVVLSKISGFSGQTYNPLSIKVHLPDNPAPVWRIEKTEVFYAIVAVTACVTMSLHQKRWL